MPPRIPDSLAYLWPPMVDRIFSFIYIFVCVADDPRPIYAIPTSISFLLDMDTSLIFIYHSHLTCIRHYLSLLTCHIYIYLSTNIASYRWGRCFFLFLGWIRAIIHPIFNIFSLCLCCLPLDYFIFLFYFALRHGQRRKSCEYVQRIFKSIGYLKEI